MYLQVTYPEVKNRLHYVRYNADEYVQMKILNCGPVTKHGLYQLPASVISILRRAGAVGFGFLAAVEVVGVTVLGIDNRTYFVYGGSHQPGTVVGVCFGRAVGVGGGQKLPQ